MSRVDVEGEKYPKERKREKRELLQGRGEERRRARKGQKEGQMREKERASEKGQTNTGISAQREQTRPSKAKPQTAQRRLKIT